MRRGPSIQKTHNLSRRGVAADALEFGGQNAPGESLGICAVNGSFGMDYHFRAKLGGVDQDANREPAQETDLRSGMFSHSFKAMPQEVINLGCHTVIGE